MRFAAAAGAAIPPAAAAIAAASSLRIWRRSRSGMAWSSRILAGGVAGVEDKRGRQHIRQQRDGIERRSDGAGRRGLDHNDKLSPRIALENLAAGERRDGGFDVREP